MPENLRVVYPRDHQGHRPQTFFNFGEMQTSLERPERIEVIRKALSALESAVGTRLRPESETTR